MSKYVIGAIGLGITLMTIVFAAGGQNEKIKTNRVEIEEHKDDAKAGFITLHKRISKHIENQKQDSKERNEKMDRIIKVVYRIEGKLNE